MSDWDGACFEPEDIGPAAAAAPADPRRRHLESCARCAALAAAYGSFVEATPAAGAEAGAASARLDSFLRREVLGGAGAGPPGRRRPRLAPAAPRMWRSPATAALAAAAVLMFLGGAWLLRTGADRPGELVLRGTVVGPAAGPAPSIAVAADGALALSWRPVAEAEAYEVRILDAHLELRRRLPAPQAELVLPAWALAELEGAPHPLLVQIAALAGGDEIAAGAPVPLTAAEAAQEVP